MAWFAWEGEDLLLTLQVQPRAARDEFAAPHGDACRLRITAPPVDGKANAHLIAYLAKTFDVSKSAVTLVSGKTSRHKRFRIRAPKTLPAVITASGT
jgi:uncharacterized protein (TIGR00251 family)